MSIDPSKVQWDDASVSAPNTIDPSKVQWDDASVSAPNDIDPAKVQWDDASGAPQEEMPLWESLRTAAVNAPGSIGGLLIDSAKFLASVPVYWAKATAETIQDPVGRVKQVYDLFATPEGQAKIIDMAKMVGGDYAKRYGSYDAIKRGFAGDPAAYLADATILLSGGASAVGATGRAASMPRLVRAGETMAGAAKAVDPFMLPANALNATRLRAPVNALASKAVGSAQRGVAGVKQYLQNFADPPSMFIEKVSKGHEADILQKLRMPPIEHVPGIKPTFGAIILGSQRVEPIAAEKALLSNRAASEVYQRGTQRKEAFGAHLTPTARDEEILRIAKAEREADRAADFAPVDAKWVESDAKLDDILDRANDAVNKAAELAKTEGRKFSIQPGAIRSEVEKAYGIKPGEPGKAVVGPAKTEMGVKQSASEQAYGARRGEAVTTTGPTKVVKGTPPATMPPRQLSGRSLSQINQKLADAITESSMSGFQNAEARAIGNLKRELEAWMRQEGKLPEYDVAVERFGSHSKEIQRLQVGQFLRGLVDDIRLKNGEATYLKYLNDPEALIKAATGRTNFKTFEDLGFTPDDLKRFGDVAKEIERSGEYARQATAGAKADIKVGVPWKHISILNIKGTLANMAMHLRGEYLGEQAADKLAKMMLNPENGDIARAFEKAIARKDKRAAEAALLRLTMPRGVKETGKALTHPATVAGGKVTNALSNEENRNALAQ